MIAQTAGRHRAPTPVPTAEQAVRGAAAYRLSLYLAAALTILTLCLWVADLDAWAAICGLAATLAVAAAGVMRAGVR